eukprot:70771-Chlamydomonas_euryale.AAC.1
MGKRGGGTEQGGRAEEGTNSMDVVAVPSQPVRGAADGARGATLGWRTGALGEWRGWKDWEKKFTKTGSGTCSKSADVSLRKRERKESGRRAEGEREESGTSA